MIAAAALCFSLYALLGVGGEAMAWGAILIAAGLPLYFTLRWRRTRAAG